MPTQSRWQHRIVFAPAEMPEIVPLFRGECQNVRNKFYHVGDGLMVRLSTRRQHDTLQQLVMCVGCNNEELWPNRN